MIQIEFAHPEHAAVLAEFQVNMAMETENLKLNPSVVTQGVATVFNEPSKGQYLIAKDESQVVASLMITYEWSDWRCKNVWWIQSVYVRPSHRKLGIYKKMYTYLLDRVKENPKLGGLRLYVDKTNHRAIGVYEKLGMDGSHYQMYEWMKS